MTEWKTNDFFTEEFYLIYVDTPSQQKMELNSQPQRLPT